MIAGVLSMFVAIPQRAAAQTITVTNPSSGSVWYASSTYTIMWTSSGAVGPVKIEYNNSYLAVSDVIVGSTANDGNYDWTVPSIIDSSSYYFIRISDVGEPAVYDDSPFFDIAGGSGSGTISVTAPSILTTWYTGSTYDITWSTTGSVGPNVRIEYSEFPCVLCTPVTITSSTPTATGRYSWAIPTSLAAGAYTITITDTSNANIDDNNYYFTIRAGSNPMLIIAYCDHRDCADSRRPCSRPRDEEEENRSSASPGQHPRHASSDTVRPAAIPDSISTAISNSISSATAGCSGTGRGDQDVYQLRQVDTGRFHLLHTLRRQDLGIRFPRQGIVPTADRHGQLASA